MKNAALLVLFLIGTSAFAQSPTTIPPDDLPAAISKLTTAVETLSRQKRTPVHLDLIACNAAGGVCAMNVCKALGYGHYGFSTEYFGNAAGQPQPQGQPGTFHWIKAVTCWD